MCEWKLPPKKQGFHLSLKSRFFLVKMCIVIIFAKENVGGKIKIKMCEV